MNPEPFRIEPTFSPRIWGALTLAPIFPEKKDLTEPLGEAWLTDVSCRVASGPFAGKTLGEAWSEMLPAWRGEGGGARDHFPLLVKFIFPADKLSVQVHPDDVYAKEHEAASGGRGKTELWHVVSAEPGSQLLLGLKPGVSREKFLASLTNKSVEDLFQQHAVKERDTFFIPPGTPHTIGPGIILCEVQQYSDLTYRVYDYGRVDAQGKPRELHVKKAMAVIKFGQPPIGKVGALSWSSSGMTVELLAACRYFAAERWCISEKFNARPPMGVFHLLVVLSGSGEIRWAADKTRYTRGECWFLPASLTEYEIVPDGESAFLRTFVPDIAALRRNLRRMGVSDSEMAGVVFE